MALFKNILPPYFDLVAQQTNNPKAEHGDKDKAAKELSSGYTNII